MHYHIWAYCVDVKRDTAAHYYTLHTRHSFVYPCFHSYIYLFMLCLLIYYWKPATVSACTSQFECHSISRAQKSHFNYQVCVDKYKMCVWHNANLNCQEGIKRVWRNDVYETLSEKIREARINAHTHTNTMHKSVNFVQFYFCEKWLISMNSLLQHWTVFFLLTQTRTLLRSKANKRRVAHWIVLNSHIHWIIILG